MTGGSRGIGRAITIALARAGADVAVGYGSHREAAEEVARDVRRAGRRAVTVGGDMADPDQVRRVASEAVERLGQVDVLVANAGIGPRVDLEDIDVAAWDRLLAVNLRAPFLLAQALAPGMRERAWGRILLMSSVASFTGGILAPHYSASKAGLIGLAHALARPLAPHGVTVNTIAPALIETDMLTDNPAIAAHLADSIPVGRLGRPDEVADLVVAVVSNAYVTGQTFLVDGGVHFR